MRARVGWGAARHGGLPPHRSGETERLSDTCPQPGSRVRGQFIRIHRRPEEKQYKTKSIRSFYPADLPFYYPSLSALCLFALFRLSHPFPNISSKLPQAQHVFYLFFSLYFVFKPIKNNMVYVYSGACCNAFLLGPVRRVLQSGAD